MKFQLYTASKSSRFASGVIWINNELVVTCADDRKLLFWNTSAHHEPIKSVSLPIDSFPTSMHYPSSVISGSTATANLATSRIDSPTFSNVKLDSQSGGLIAIGTTAGCFHLFPLNWNGSRIDKTFEAHTGAIIVIRWSNDSSTLATGGEDGLVKIWSRVGMLRSTIMASNLPVYALSWSPDSNSLVHNNGNHIVVKSLSPQSKTVEWLAHEGLIVSLHWSVINGLILSAGEDGRVKMWDSTGRLLFVSAQHSSALTSVSWSPDGELFAVSTFNALKLHELSGTCVSVEKLSNEGIHTLSWSCDSNQVCCVCSNGQVFFSYIVERVLESNAWQLIHASRRAVKVHNVTNDMSELLEFRDPVLRMSFSHDRLVVVTVSQCFIYETTNWSSPHYFDTNSANIAMVKQSRKHFLLLTTIGANLYTYDGRFLKTIKMPNFRTDLARPNSLSLNDQTLSYKDGVNLQTVHFIDIDSGKNFQNKDRTANLYRHLLEVSAVKLSPEGGKQSDQLCAVVDKNDDLYVVLVNDSTKSNVRAFKLSSMIKDFSWHLDYNTLVSLNDNKSLSLWLYPYATFVDSSLLQDVVLPIDNEQLSSNSRIVEFDQNQITVQRFDAVKIYIAVNPFITLLHKYKATGQWQEAIRVCNFLDKSIHEVEPIEQNIRNALWATLAVMSLEAKEFQIAEIAYAAINKLDKVLYLNRIKSLPNTELITAELELMCGNQNGAEHFLVQKGFVLRSILLHLELHHWNRALELAAKFNDKFKGIKIESNNSKHKTKTNSYEDDDINLESDINVNLIHLVLSCRKQYLQNKQKRENINEFQTYYNELDHIVDWSTIEKQLKNNNKIIYEKI